MERAAKRLKHKLSFPPKGERELRQLHSHVLANLKLAFGYLCRAMSRLRGSS